MVENDAEERAQSTATAAEKKRLERACNTSHGFDQVQAVHDLTKAGISRQKLQAMPQLEITDIAWDKYEDLCLMPADGAPLHQLCATWKGPEIPKGALYDIEGSRFNPDEMQAARIRVQDTAKFVAHRFRAVKMSKRREEDIRSVDWNDLYKCVNWEGRIHEGVWNFLWWQALWDMLIELIPSMRQHAPKFLIRPADGQARILAHDLRDLMLWLPATEGKLPMEQVGAIFRNRGNTDGMFDASIPAFEIVYRQELAETGAHLEDSCTSFRFETGPPHWVAYVDNVPWEIAKCIRQGFGVKDPDFKQMELLRTAQRQCREGESAYVQIENWLEHYDEFQAVVDARRVETGKAFEQEMIETQPNSLTALRAQYKLSLGQALPPGVVPRINFHPIKRRRGSDADPSLPLSKRLKELDSSFTILVDTLHLLKQCGMPGPYSIDQVKEPLSKRHWNERQLKETFADVTRYIESAADARYVRVFRTLDSEILVDLP